MLLPFLAISLTNSQQDRTEFAMLLTSYRYAKKRSSQYRRPSPNAHIPPPSEVQGNQVVVSRPISVRDMPKPWTW
jgi:hypothetical protein